MRSCALVLALVVAALPLSAAAQTEPIPVQVTAIASNGPFTELDREVLAAFEAEATRRAETALSEQPRVTMLVGSQSLPDTDLVMLSVVALASLPEELIEMGVDEEVFYQNVSAEQRAEQRANLPPEGRAVRAHLSEEFLRAFGAPREHLLMATPAAELDQTVIQIFDRMF